MSLFYDDAIRTARTQIILDPEMQCRARQRAADLGMSLAEYVRRLVERDLGHPQTKADPSSVFDLGRSNGSGIAKDKNEMIAAAFASARRKRRRR